MKQDEDDGYDEALVPLDYKETGLIVDDVLYDIIVNKLPDGVHAVAIVRILYDPIWPSLPRFRAVWFILHQ